jgi:hypothetical protein
MASIDSDATLEMNDRPSSSGSTGNSKLERIQSHSAAEAEKAQAATTDDGIPDGGYGWVVAFAMLASNSVSWGQNSSYGVYLSYYLANDTFKGATPLQYAFIGGLSISQGLMVAPLANYLTRRYHFKVPLIIGTACLTTAQICAGFAVEIWQLFLTQGFLFGWGLGCVLCLRVTCADVLAQPGLHTCASAS